MNEVNATLPPPLRTHLTVAGGHHFGLPETGQAAIQDDGVRSETAEERATSRRKWKPGAPWTSSRCSGAGDPSSLVLDPQPPQLRQEGGAGGQRPVREAPNVLAGAVAGDADELPQRALVDHVLGVDF